MGVLRVRQGDSFPRAVETVALPAKNHRTATRCADTPRPDDALMRTGEVIESTSIRGVGEARRQAANFIIIIIIIIIVVVVSIIVGGLQHCKVLPSSPVGGLQQQEGATTIICGDHRSCHFISQKGKHFASGSLFRWGDHKMVLSGMGRPPYD
uniref:Uncharacterized protein n=1 Tax=Anopheles farauti TaxID=69004 RepID=A0A182QEV3_9DIPT